MSELTKGFEKVFPLPWKMQRRGTWEYINAKNGKGCNICIIPATDYEPKKATRQYLVQCANLMPEAVELLKAAQETMNEACTVCAEDLGERCATCDREEIDCRITAFLSKLEGGADDEAH